MELLEYKYNLLEIGQTEIETALKVISKRENLFIRFLKTLKKFVFGTNGKKQKIPYEQE